MHEIKMIVINYFEIIIGAFIMAFGVSMFLLPNTLSSGGFSGIATIFYYKFQISMGAMIILLNVPFFILAYFRLGKSFVLRAIIGTVLLSIFIDLLERITPFTDDLFLNSIYGGIIIGIGNAIILRAKASTGGTELIILILRTFKKNIKTGNMLMIADIVIVAINILVFGRIEIGLYSAIAIYIIGIIIDLLYEGVNFSKMILIISDMSEDIAKRIHTEIEKGATGLFGKGMYTGKEKTVVVCVASRREVMKIREIANEIDKNSFIVITNAREVFGEGFK